MIVWHLLAPSTGPHRGCANTVLRAFLFVCLVGFLRQGPTDLAGLECQVSCLSRLRAGITDVALLRSERRKVRLGLLIPLV